MKFATFRHHGTVHVGVVDPQAGTVAPLPIAADEAQGVAGLIGLETLPMPADPMPLAMVEVLAPIPRPRRNVFCVGKNYASHVEELARAGFDSAGQGSAPPKAPILFSKVPESVIGPGQPILIDPAVSTAIDYEAELAVIIGKQGRGIRRAEAMDHVWGYTLVNDITARDLQGRHAQWLIGKGQDTFCPMGPWAVLREDVDLSNSPLRCTVNGEERQNSHTGLMIFDVPTIIESLSAGLTLYPGDVIATGTPMGVGMAFKPPKYLSDGDTVRVDMPAIGVLENPVRLYPGS